MTRDCKPVKAQPVNSADHAAKTGGNAAETPETSSPDVGTPFWRVKRLDEMNGGTIAFDIDPDRKHRLLNGIDDIGETLEKAPAIDAYEAKMKAAHPWV